MRVVEIGCGESAGPYFEAADEHIITDISDEAIASSMEHDSRFTPLIADSAELSEVISNSVDIVLARNVFGDPHLGVGSKGFIRSMKLGEVSVLDDIKEKKIAIMYEAARMLLPGGNLVVVEQYSPMVAEDFVNDLVNRGLVPPSLTLPAPTQLHLVTPKNYSEHHRRYNPDVWVATRLA